MAELKHRFGQFSGALAMLLVTACATAPRPAVIDPAPAPSPQLPPATTPPAPVTAVTPPRPATPSDTRPLLADGEARATYTLMAFSALPAVSATDWIAMWPAFLNSCSALARRDAWRDVCAQTLVVDARNSAAIREFFFSRFDVYGIGARQPDGDVRPDARVVPARTSLVTGYYEPLLRGSRKRSAKYPVPLYRVPDDLIVIDLASVYPELSNMRLRGKLQGRRVVPYPTRGEITSANALAGQELLWVDDSIDAFFLQIQGSGRVQFDDGSTVRVGYGDQNGHPYRSLGRWLVDQGQLTLDQASMQGIKAWARRNPARLKEALDQNASYVFFRELPLGNAGAGPLGALGVPLTPGYSLAADARFVPLGAPVMLATTDPDSQAPLVRPMVAQDTGGAIRGPLRFDFFWGFGAAAGERAGRQRHDASAWVLVPKGATPESLLVKG